MELFETQGILKPLELLKQGVFCPSEIDGTDGIIPLFFAQKGIPSVFKNSIGFQQYFLDFEKISSVLKSFLGFKKFHGFQKVPWVFILCFQVKNVSWF